MADRRDDTITEIQTGRRQTDRDERIEIPTRLRSRVVYACLPCVHRAVLFAMPSPATFRLNCHYFRISGETRKPRGQFPTESFWAP